MADKPIDSNHGRWIHSLLNIGTRKFEPKRGYSLASQLCYAVNVQLHAAGMQTPPHHLSVNEATVDGWLTADALPENRAVHDALMAVLGLEDTPGTTAQQKVRHGIRQKMEAFYDAAPATLKQPIRDASIATTPHQGDHARPEDVKAAATGEPTQQARMRTATGTAAADPKVSYRPDKYKDHSAIPKRVGGNVDYKGRTREELRGIMVGGHGFEATENFFELMRCARILKYKTVEKLAEHINRESGLNIEHSPLVKIEMGKQLPTAQFYAVLKQALFYDDPQGAARFDYVLVKNRVAMAKAEIASGTSWGSRYGGVQLGALPRFYWQEVLERHLDKDTWEKKPNKPVWAQENGLLLDITTQSEYLRALRGWNEMSRQDFADVLGIGESNVHGIESGDRYLSDRGNSFDNYLMTLELLQEQALREGKKPFFTRGEEQVPLYSEAHAKELTQAVHDRRHWVDHATAEAAKKTREQGGGSGVA